MHAEDGKDGEDGGDGIAPGDKSGDVILPSGSDDGLVLSHSRMDFGALAQSRTLFVRWTGASSAVYTVHEGVPWLAVESDTGTNAGEWDMVRLNVDRSVLGTGNFATYVTVRVNDTQAAVLVSVITEDEAAYGISTPRLDVTQDELAFTVGIDQRAFHIRNCNGGTLQYAVSSPAQWLSVSPIRGTSTGEFDAMLATVDRSNVPTGLQVAEITVTADGCPPHVITCWTGVDFPSGDGAPLLELSTASIDFGYQGLTRSLRLENVGGGSLSFAIATTADWLQVSPATGRVSSSSPLEVLLTADRTALHPGAYTADLLISSDAGAPRSITVAVDKAVTSPKMIPWVECNGNAPYLTDPTVDGLRKWQRMTDTAIVSTVIGAEGIYDVFAQQVPGMTIIPGFKTSNRLGWDDFDNVAGWQQIAADVAYFADYTGVHTVLLENEGAIKSFRDGDTTIYYTELARGLSYLPDDVEIIWYPSLPCACVPGYASRLKDVCQVVADNVAQYRFPEFRYSHPDWYDEDCIIAGQQTLEAISGPPVMPLVYMCCSDVECYWSPDRILEIMPLVQGYDEMIVYPGTGRWISAPTTISELLGQHPSPGP